MDRARRSIAGDEPSRGPTSPYVIGLIAILAAAMGVWAVVYTVKTGRLEKDLAALKGENEKLTRDLLKVTIERDDVAKEKEELAKQVTALQQAPSGLNEMLASLMPLLNQKKSETGQSPYQIVTKSGRRVKVSDGGASGFSAGAGGMMFPGAGGMPAMDPAAVMSQLGAMNSRMQGDTMRRMREAESGMRGEAAPEPEPEPLTSEEREKRRVDSEMSKQLQILSFQLGLSRDQESQVDAAMKEIGADLFPAETRKSAGTTASGSAAPTGGSVEDGGSAKATERFERSSDLFARKMKEILTPDQFASFQNWRKNRR